jgi:hypothetical protein
VKLELRYDLGDEEKEHHVCAKQFAKIHPGRVQEEAVANQHDGSQQEPTDSPGPSRVIKAGLKAGVTLHFKVSGNHQD